MYRYSLKVVWELKYQRFHHVDPHIRQLIIIVYYHAKGMTTSQIAAIEPLPERLIQAIIRLSTVYHMINFDPPLV